MNTAITNGQTTSRLNRREIISYGFLVCLVILGIAVLTMLLGFAMPRPINEVYVGKVSDFPPLSTPHLVYQMRSIHIIIINTLAFTSSIPAQR